ncbi:hypothetical protein [Micromonospora halophytica]|uniref:Uncharacterized protein n=1 Tax=Micromonospora halophytica TaxID=47864 RepID=A0A1C5J872_9ACTN|nr:hypothetical protein [Micromonospora halophytica]SCG66461.1 hypothetical protein GA0070560_12355 [Micromonospora halophytica]
MSLAGRSTFRANPRYDLVPADRLTQADRRLLGEDADLYGVLRPQPGSELDARSCSTDVALLFLTLKEPGALPAFARHKLGGDAEGVLARLVADGVVEVLTGRGFVSGAAAADVLSPVGSSAGQGRIAELSMEALRYGQTLEGLSAEALAPRLYSYGRIPYSPALRRRVPDERATEKFVGDVAGPGWAQRPAWSQPRSPWRLWTRASLRHKPHDDVAYKLYVSPAFDAVPAAVAAVSGTLAASRGVIAFKVARDVCGLCRPDKLVVYFDRLDDLRQGASLLAQEIAGMPAHGVPFTSAVTLDGLLSWGADPPPDARLRTSWRMWVTQHLADYLAAAAGRTDEPWQFALQRLQMAGVDTDTWAPTGSTWREALP